MAVDKWSSQEGVIVEGLVCGFGYADGAIAEGDWVTWGTSASNRVAVTPVVAASLHQGWARAMKAAAAAGDIVPLVISGIVKVTTNETLVIGTMVGAATATEVTGIGASNIMTINGGTQTLIGALLQSSETPGTECLMVMNQGVVGITG